MAQKFTVPITVKQLASAGSDAVTVYVDQDTYSRLKVEAGGRLTWGSGASAGDVNLYRASADVLQTDDTFKTPTLFVDNIEIDPTGAVTNDVLVYNGSKFTAASVALGGGGGASLTVSDTAPASPTEGDLWFNSSNARTYVYYDSSWVEVGGSGGVATLDDIGDVTTPSPTTNDVLQWNGTAWVNVAASTVGATNLDGLSDVVITSPEEFQTLEYNGTNWVNAYASTVTYVRNAEATTLTTGTVVYLFGATGDHATVKRADKASDTTSSKTVGLVGANITASNNGPVVTRGYVDGIDLSVGYSPGDVLWLGSNGAFTKTKATAPDHLVFVGVVVRATNNGIIYVATQNGYELDELHNVNASSPSPGDFLKYNGSLWVNDAINLGTDTVGDYVSSVSAGTGISVNFAPGEGVGASVSLNATLDDLSNVSVATPNTNDVLTYNGSSWTAASVAAGGSTVTASTAPPSSPVTGSIWFDSNTAKTYVYYDSFWVEIGGTSGGAKMYVSQTAPTSPLEGQLWFKSDTAQTFAYYDSFWVEVGAAGMAAIAADAAPASPVTGQIWFNTSTGATYVYYDSYWIEVGAVAANTVFNLVDAKGDLLLGTADNTLARQAVGTNGQLLQANSATSTGVQWVTPTYAPLASPTFTGTVTIPAGASISGFAPLSGPTFTGTVTLPSTTSIGNVSSTEIGYVDGVTSAIQTQLDAKAPTVSPNFTSGITTSGITNNGNLNTAGNIQQNMVHGYNFRQELAAGNNGAGTGIAQLNIWISEPGATWTGAGIARNRSNSGGGFARVNTGLSAQMIRFGEPGSIDFTCTTSAGSENSFSFDPNGQAYKAGGGSWTALSDIRLKDNVRDYDKGTAELMQVRVREWEHNGKGGLQTGSKGLGVVADEIELVLPDTVHTYEGKLNPEDEETTDIKSVNPTEITWLLVKTVQEQQAKIEALTARLEALEA